MYTNTIERKIMWGDLDALGIVFYPRYYEWIDASGHLFFEAIDLNMQMLWQSRNLLFGLVETSCKYHRPGRYHQLIHIKTSIRALTEKTLSLKHDITSAHDGALMVSGTENRICLDVTDPGNFRAVRIPDKIYAMLEKAYRDI